MSLVRYWQLNTRPRWGQLVLAAVAVILGLAIARLPLLWGGILLIASILVILAVVDPLNGLVITLILGPSKPLTDYFVPQLPLDLGQIALLITLGSWFLHAVSHRKQQLPATPFTLPLLGFLGIGILSALEALSIGFAGKELIKWSQLLIMIWLVIDLAGARRWRVVVGAVLAAAAIEGLIGVWQFGIRGDGPETFLILGDRFYRAYGTFEQPNPYGGFIGMILSLSIGLTLGAVEAWLKPAINQWKDNPHSRWVHLFRKLKSRSYLLVLGFALLTTLLGIALMMSWSRGAWLGFAVAAIVLVFAWPRKTWIGAALVISAVVVGILALRSGLLPASIEDRATGFSEFLQSFDVRGVDINDANYAVLERLAHWQAAESMAQYHFWLGVGIGNYEPVYPAYRLLNWEQPLGHAHNIYLNTLAEMGIIGLIAYVGLWTVIFWQTWRITCGMDLWMRSTAVGLMGTWTHLSVHNFIDKLYVANIHLHIGALLGVLSIFIALQEKGKQISDGND